jgi:hypothetical protein
MFMKNFILGALFLFFSIFALAATNLSGELLVQTTPSVLFHDTFDVSFDTINNWLPAVSAVGGVGESFSPGGISLGTGTTANGYSYVTGRTSFPLSQPGFVETGISLNVPAALPTNAYAAWGSFTPTATPTAASPIQEGCGFELQPGGKMYVACYAGAVRTVIQDLSAATGNGKQPIDGGTHRYVQDFAGDQMSWYIDNKSNVVAVQLNGVNGPNVNMQPVTILAVAGTSAPSSSLTLNVASTWVADTGHNAGQISDGTYPSRKAQVASNNALKVETNNTYNHIATAATTTVKSGAGNLHSVTVNSLGTVASTLTIYDNTASSGAVIGIINTLALSGTFTFDVAFTIGLTIVTTGTVAPDVTVSYR